MFVAPRPRTKRKSATSSPSSPSGASSSSRAAFSATSWSCLRSTIFLSSYAGPFITPMPSLKEYMNLTLKLLIIFGFIFEMPLVAYYLSRVGIINTAPSQKKEDTPSSHRRRERHHYAPGADEPDPHGAADVRPLRGERAHCTGVRKEGESTCRILTVSYSQPERARV